MTDFRLHQQPPTKPNQILETLRWVGKYWFQLVIAFFIVHLYVKNDPTIVIQHGGNPGTDAANLVSEKVQVEDAEMSLASITGTSVPTKPEKPARKTVSTWKSSDFRNLSFVFDPEMADRKGVEEAIVQEKMRACRKYVERFAKTAITEMETYGIPASITLAQGLLETDAGGSRLASESNNHFGIKCRTKCLGCTCRNYSDDDVYDMFRVFDSAWESFREHSKLLTIDRYSHLKKLGTSDYESWAVGLRKAGYATDKNYHKKLVKIIEQLDLHQFDK